MTSTNPQATPNTPPRPTHNLPGRQADPSSSRGTFTKFRRPVVNQAGLEIGGISPETKSPHPSPSSPCLPLKLRIHSRLKSFSRTEIDGSLRASRLGSHLGKLRITPRLLNQNPSAGRCTRVKVTDCIRCLRRCCAVCRVGDAVEASRIPEWDSAADSHSYDPGRPVAPGAKPWQFRRTSIPGLYDAMDWVWVRVA